MDITAQAAAPAVRKRAWRLDRYLTANLLLWLLTYALITLRTVGMDKPMPHAGEMALRRIAVCAAGVVVCMAIQRVLTAARGRPLGARVALAAGLSLGGAACWAGVNHVVFYLIRPHAEWGASSGLELAYGALMNVTVIVWTFIAWCAVVFAIDYDQTVREQALKVAQAQALAAESQNRMLRYQINPHFLFNTFNALSSLILQKDYARAEQVVLSLSGFLRASLETGAGDRSTLAAELEAQRQYLAIEEIRFGERLQLEVNVGPGLETAQVPSLILQPLVENAVKHGVARSTAPVRLEISARAIEGRLELVVQDDARPDIAAAPVTLGVGLENVRRRLEVMYGEAGRMACGRRRTGGFSCVLSLPLELA